MTTNVTAQPPVTSVELGLTEVTQSSKIKEVKIGRLRLGQKFVTFNFSIKHKGAQTPTQTETLKQLALGCKRALEGAYARKQSLVNQLQTLESSLSKSDKKLLKTTQKELRALDHIQKFQYKLKNGKPTLTIIGKNPGSHEKIRVDLFLDPEFSGVEKALKLTKDQLEATLNETQACLTSLPSLNINIEDDEDEESSIYPEMQSQISDLTAQCELLKKQLEAIEDPDLCTIEIIQEQKEGQDTFIYVPKVKLFTKNEEGDLEPLDNAYVTVPLEGAVLHFDGQVATHKDILNKIHDVCEQALKGDSEEEKEFQKKINPKPNFPMNALRQQQMLQAMQQRVS